ncbi:M23 family metallopeptidase [Stenotrophomonas sp. MMGLT7]|uniref:M23 family metallopeptidase n=1 Tax=Stenotrophomonas sp. MMGLT7 TaxID=2901227 RepID=UPI001E4F83BE|nr:M23 family metallopeptidase [Stenotrophomonas sp. MMGLT7]MCD7098274.1 M23 family metallopeptidase [Stenotrophomonas sp. MMGLT7]
MTFNRKIVIKSPVKGSPRVQAKLLELARRRPSALLGGVLGAGLLLGFGASVAIGAVHDARLSAKVEQQQRELAQVRQQAQAEVNALAARLGELQAQATRLNALGERLTQVGRLEDGEFDFNEPVGIGGGDEPAQDMPVGELKQEMGRLQKQLSGSGQQLGVLEALLFDHQLEQNAVPSRMPIRNTYITSGFGGRADPFKGGASNHKGIDFHARVGDPVLAVADGVVSYSGVRGGYGNVVEIEHGNGYMTRYAHNSRLTVRAGDLVRAGQELAKAGSSGRSTGAHVHFEVWQNGRVMNPRKFLGDGGNTPVGRRGRA